jgi:hypothetical protein
MIDDDLIPRTEEQSRLVHDFLERTAYGPSEILSLHYDDRIFLMRNGGVYRMDEDGRIVDIKGPPSDPNERL